MMQIVRTVGIAYLKLELNSVFTETNFNIHSTCKHTDRRSGISVGWILHIILF